MTSWKQQVLVGVAIAAAIGVAAKLTTDVTVWWVFPVFGALLAVVIWSMLYFGEVARSSVATAEVLPRTYAIAGVLAVILGALFGAFTNNLAFWPVGAIFAALIAQGTVLATSGGGRGERA